MLQHEKFVTFSCLPWKVFTSFSDVCEVVAVDNFEATSDAFAIISDVFAFICDILAAISDDLDPLSDNWSLVSETHGLAFDRLVMSPGILGLFAAWFGAWPTAGSIYSTWQVKNKNAHTSLTMLDTVHGEMLMT